MLPNRCTISKGGRQCSSPPQYVISVAASDGEYMVGVTCSVHKQTVTERIRVLQEEGKLPSGSVWIEPLYAVGTDCIKSDADSLVQIR